MKAETAAVVAFPRWEVIYRNRIVGFVQQAFACSIYRNTNKATFDKNVDKYAKRNDQGTCGSEHFGI